MLELNYKSDLRQLEDAIADKSYSEHTGELEILLANVNCLFGLLMTREGAQADIFPINAPQRAVKFLVSAYAMNIFNMISTIVDLLMIGKYTEAGSLIRSLIENVAYSEYYSQLPDVAMQIVSNIESLPSKTAVFRHLATHGRWPLGGPRRSYERHNMAAHGNIAYALSHIAEAYGTPQATHMYLRRYNGESFTRISRACLGPLFGIQQIFRDVFDLDNQSPSTVAWSRYWDIGHNRERIRELFPGTLAEDHEYEEFERRDSSQPDNDSD